MAAKTGYWRITTKSINGVTNFRLFDHLPDESTRNALDVRIQVPGATELLQLTEADLGQYEAANPGSYSLDIAPEDVSDVSGTSFPDGVYRFKIVFQISTDTYTYDEYYLHIPEIDKCITDKLNTYLKSMCNLCKETDQLRTLQELVVIRQGIMLDLNPAIERITSAKEKVTLLQNICEGNGCTCVCGC